MSGAPGGPSMNPLGSARSRRLLSAAVVLLLAAAAFWLKSSQPPDSLVVLRVVDGDTLRATYHGQPERLRLIGLDAPESRANPKAWRNAAGRRKNLAAILRLGVQAKDFVTGLVQPGDVLKLELDAQARDRYGRLLGYVYLKDGRMLNELILRSGYAYPLTIPPNVRYQARFLEAFQQARQEHAGLWKSEPPAGLVAGDSGPEDDQPQPPAPGGALSR